MLRGPEPASRESLSSHGACSYTSFCEWFGWDFEVRANCVARLDSHCRRCPSVRCTCSWADVFQTAASVGRGRRCSRAVHPAGRLNVSICNNCKTKTEDNNLRQKWQKRQSVDRNDRGEDVLVFLGKLSVTFQEQLSRMCCPRVLCRPSEILKGLKRCNSAGTVLQIQIPN